MICAFNYCIYNNKSTCILDGVQVDLLGMCNSCVIVTIPEKALKNYKEARLKEIQKIWKTYDK